MSDEPEVRANIREILGLFIGQRLLDISQNEVGDLADPDEDGFIQLMFENGQYIKFFITDNEHYKAKSPLCFTDGHEVDDEYVPSLEDAAARKWAVVSWCDEHGSVYHVIPTFGRNHCRVPECWCNPKKSYRDDGSYFYVHNEE
jgi:hypothetical protein